MPSRDIVMAAAGVGGGSSTTYIEDVFSTYLYTGNGSTQTITNGIDLIASTGAWTLYSTSTGSGYSWNALNVDSSGNMYVNLQGTGNDFLVKIDSSGSVVWSKYFTSGDETFGVTTDSSGNVYTTFITYPAGGRTPQIIKYSSGGTLQWKRQISPLSTIGGRQYGIAVDSSGNVATAGHNFQNDGIVPGTQVLLNSSGSTSWAKSVKGSSGTYPHGFQYNCAFDSSGNVYFVGSLNSGTSYANLSKYNSAGTLQWNKTFYVSGSTGGFYSIAIDSSDNIYVVGATQSNAYVCKYNTSGTVIWQYKTSNASAFNSVAVHNSSGDIFVTSDVGDLIRINSSGTIVWKVKFNEAAFIPVSCTNTYVYAKVNGTSIAKLPVDGSAIAGSLNGVSLGTSSVSLTSGSASVADVTYASGSSLTVGASSVTEGDSGVTVATYNQAAVSNGGGMVWVKCRSNIADNIITDSARGAWYQSVTNSTAAQTYSNLYLPSLNSNGFSLASTSTVNNSGYTYSSWTFRKAPKFFDVVTYTGNGVAGRTISHSLGQAPGMIIVKCTDVTYNWSVYHRSTGATQYLILNSTTPAYTSADPWNNTTPTASSFTLGADATVNANGRTYVAYLFAHDTTTDGLIQCGSFTTGASGFSEVNLGWEPQYILFKTASVSLNWYVWDTMRGMSLTSGVSLSPNLSREEFNWGSSSYVYPTAKGFAGSGDFFGNGANVIYMAIRRGPMRTPTDPTTVFNPVLGSSTAPQFRSSNFNSGIDSGLTFYKPGYDDGTNAYPNWNTRLLGTGQVQTPNDRAQISIANNLWDYMNGYGSYTGLGTQWGSWLFKRAPGFFDVVCYTGTGVARTVNHNLGVAPELMIVKRRNAVESWYVYGAPMGNTIAGILNSDMQPFTSLAAWNNTSPTNSVFTVATETGVNNNGSNYVAYLFASCPGVSKVGSYTGTGSTQTISCGFTGGARFVLIKRTDSTGNWYVWDTVRGMVSGTDPSISLNSVAAEVNANSVYTTTGGFQIVSTAAGINASGGSYIYLAIA